MIEEDYVSFELAKMLKEKGFDEYCSHFYRVDGEHECCYRAKLPRLTNNDIIKHDDWVNRVFACTCPTLQMAQKWFREEKHLAINPSTYYRELEGHEFHNWGCNIVNLDTWEVYCSSPLETFPADTYEEALEKAMKYALEKFV